MTASFWKQEPSCVAPLILPPRSVLEAGRFLDLNCLSCCGVMPSGGGPGFALADVLPGHRDVRIKSCVVFEDLLASLAKDRSMAAVQVFPVSRMLIIERVPDATSRANAEPTSSETCYPSQRQRRPDEQTRSKWWDHVYETDKRTLAHSTRQLWLVVFAPGIQASSLLSSFPDASSLPSASCLSYVALDSAALLRTTDTRYSLIRSPIARRGRAIDVLSNRPVPLLVPQHPELLHHLVNHFLEGSVRYLAGQGFAGCFCYFLAAGRQER